MSFFDQLMKENKVEGEILCCVVIPDYHQLYKLEWKREHLITRYDLLRLKTPLLKCFVRKEYLDPDHFDTALKTIDYKIDTNICQDLTGSHLAFIVFDKISTARAVKLIAQ